MAPLCHITLECGPCLRAGCLFAKNLFESACVPSRQQLTGEWAIIDAYDGCGSPGDFYNRENDAEGLGISNLILNTTELIIGTAVLAGGWYALRKIQNWMREVRELSLNREEMTPFLARTTTTTTTTNPAPPAPPPSQGQNEVDDGVMQNMAQLILQQGDHLEHQQEEVLSALSNLLRRHHPPSLPESESDENGRASPNLMDDDQPSTSSTQYRELSSEHNEIENLMGGLLGFINDAMRTSNDALGLIDGGNDLPSSASSDTSTSTLMPVLTPEAVASSSSIGEPAASSTPIQSRPAEDLETPQTSGPPQRPPRSNKKKAGVSSRGRTLRPFKKPDM